MVNAAVVMTGACGVGTGGRIRADDGSRIIPLTLELGGKSANIIFADADLEAAVNGSVRPFTTNAGQICSSGTRLLVHRSIYDEIVARVVAKVEV